MADILVTGGTGLLGSSLVPLLAADHEVVAIGRRPPEPQAGVRWIIHDLRRPTLPPDLPGRIDVVIHLAQAREFREFPSRAMDTYAVNVGSTALLLDWACRAGARQFIVASSGSVYGNASTPHREDEPINVTAGVSYYAASKVASEVLAQAYGSHFAVVVLRPFFIYGRGQERRMLLPRIVESLRSGVAISLAGEEGIRINPIHVSDVTRAVVAALELREGAVVNVAGPEVLTLRGIAELLASCLGKEAMFKCQPNSVTTDVIGDISKMRTLLLEPRTRLPEVVEELCTVGTTGRSRERLSE